MMGIYEICNLQDGKATAYVGSAVDVQQRWWQHQSLLRHGHHHNPHLQRAWDKYGEAAFEWGIVEEVQDEANLLGREQHWLDRYLETPDTCYNIARCAESPMRGHNHTEETKRRMSEARSGVPKTAEHRRRMSEANRGKKLSRETKRKISEAHKGKKHSEESKRKIGEAHKGMGHSKEARRKISEALRGNQYGKATARPYPAFVHHETREIIPAGTNLRELCRERGLNSSHMSAVKNGKRKSHKGWTLLEKETR